MLRSQRGLEPRGIGSNVNIAVIVPMRSRLKDRTMSKLTLVKADTGKLLKLVANLLKGYAQMHDDLHAMACSVCYHAAKHGDVRPLNTFFNGLNVNYQTAFRFWIGRAFTANEKARCLEWSKKEGWAMIGKTDAERKSFITMIEHRLLNPDGKTFTRFYERNVITEQYFFGDEDIAAALHRLINKAETDDPDKRKATKVSPELLIALKRATAKADEIVGEA